MSEVHDDPAAYCNQQVVHFREKANRNKAEALGCFVTVIGCTLINPMLVMLGTDLWLGKVLPASLSLFAAGATAWLQLRKPQQLWPLYRTAQRELEHERVHYDFRIGEYEERERAARLLAERVAQISLSVHRQWIPLVPTPERLPQRERGVTQTAAGPEGGTGPILR